MYSYTTRKIEKTSAQTKHFPIQRMETDAPQHYAHPPIFRGVTVYLCDLSLVIRENPNVAHEALERPDVIPDLVDKMKKGRIIDPICLSYVNDAIIDGRHRVQAALQIGYKRIPCIYINADSEPMDLPGD